jgi:hypothetical protein
LIAGVSGPWLTGRGARAIVFVADVRDPYGVGMVSCGARCPGVFAPLAALRPPATVHDPSGVAPPPAGRTASESLEIPPLAEPALSERSESNGLGRDDNLTYC